MGELVKFYPKFYVETQDLKNTTHFKNELLTSVKNNDCLKGPLALLLYLLRNKAFPMQSDNTKHKIKSVWYDQRGKIVSSRSVKRMAKDLGVDNRSVRRWINELLNIGFIKVEKEKRENVYILGEIVENQESYFYAGYKTEEDIKLSNDLMTWTRFMRSVVDKK